MKNCKYSLWIDAWFSPYASQFFQLAASLRCQFSFLGHPADPACRVYSGFLAACRVWVGYARLDSSVSMGYVVASMQESPLACPFSSLDPW